MLPAVLLALLFVPARPVKTSDAAMLARVDRAARKLDDKRTSFRRFERELPLSPSNVAIWQRLLKKVPANSDAYAELSFTLAYYGVDYPANLHRLLRPYRAWTHNAERWYEEYPKARFDKGFTSIFSIITCLNVLYLKHHELHSLGTWLDMELDGHWAEECDYELSELWKRHSADMLLAASYKPARLHHLYDAFSLDEMVGKQYNGKDETPRTLAHLKTLSHSPNQRVATAARELSRIIRKETRTSETQ